MTETNFYDIIARSFAEEIAEILPVEKYLILTELDLQRVTIREVYKDWVGREYSVSVDFNTSGIKISLFQHDKISSLPYDNRTESLVLDLNSPNCIDHAIVAIQRHFSLRWGSSTRPWEPD